VKNTRGGSRGAQVSRRVKMACRLGNETRVAEVKIRTDTINAEAWQLQPDGTYTHEQLEQLAREWVLSQLELRVWTSDGSGPRLFALTLPGESASGIVNAATEHTRDTSRRQPPPGKGAVCPECLEERNRGQPWEGPADTWKS